MAVDIGCWEQIIQFSKTDAPACSISDASTLTPYMVLLADGDASVGNWTDASGAVTNLYQSVDEERADDSDYIRSDAFPVASVVEFTLTNTGVTVGTGAGEVQIRYYKESAEVVNLTVRLMQGLTVIKTWTYTDIDFDVLQVDEVLTAGEVATITDGAALTLQYEASWTP